MAARKPTAAAKRRAAAAKRKATALRKRQQAAFLEAFAKTHLVTEACKQAGIRRQCVYEWRAADPMFAAEWAESEERSTELLEREAYRRAAVGVDKPVFHKGELVDTVKEYSDVLLIFLLKARRPDTYREHHKHEHSGPEGGPISAEIVGVNAREAADATREFLARLAGPDA